MYVAYTILVNSHFLITTCLFSIQMIAHYYLHSHFNDSLPFCIAVVHSVFYILVKVRTAEEALSRDWGCLLLVDVATLEN